ncbi:MAG TPA: hypothetical protein VGL19_02555, partial [Polyangiaceae bacterium]
MALARHALVGSFAVVLLACTAGAQKPAIESALGDAKVRHESFEATLRALDDHPEYVPEFLELATRHPATLDAFLEDTARRLEGDPLARRTATHLANHPKAIKQVLISTLDAVSDKPPGEDAAAQAMASRPQLAAIVISQREDALKSTLHALIVEVLKNARARRWFLQGMAENSDQLASMI